MDGNQANDGTWFDKIHKEFWEEIVRTAARWLHPHLRTDAEDIAEEAFERGWRKRYDPKFRDHPRPWLHTTTQNLAKNHNRRSSNKTPQAGLDEHTTAHDGGIPLAELRNDIAAALARLSSKEQQLFWLTWTGQTTIAETAEKAGMSVDATKKAISRMRKKLHRWITP